MDYSDMSEGYGTEQIPFRPAQWQSAPVDYRYPDPPRRPASEPAPVRTQGARGNAQKRLPKAQALALVRHLKQTLVVGSLLCFGTTSGLIINQITSVSQQTATPTAPAAPATSSKTTTSTASTASQSSSQTGATSQQNSSTQTGTSSTSAQQQGGGYGFGSTSASQPVSQSHTSPSRHTP